MRDAKLTMESRVPHHIPGGSPSLVSQPALGSRVPYGRLQHPLTIYPIDQMKSSHVENDYIDSPAVVSQQPPGQKACGRVTGLPQSHEALLGVIHPNPNQNHHHHHHQQQHHLNHHNQHHHLGRCEPHQDTTTHPWISFNGRPSSISSSSSTSSEQRLLDHAAPTPTADHHHNPHQQQHPQSTVNTRSPSCFPPESKALASASGAKPPDLTGTTSTPVAAGVRTRQTDREHLLPCESCGKCRCTECTLPRTLPTCWLCNQECLCSAQRLVDSATCMCLVRGILYHCAEDEDDDEGSCADKPCSCSHADCCARWSLMAALSLVLPCLVCYLPATGLAKLSQRCYDGARRPGCRCKGPAAGGVSAAPGGQGVEAKVVPPEKEAPRGS